MTRRNGGRAGRSTSKFVIVMSASAVVAAAGAGAFFSSSGVVTLPFTPTAAIDTSNTSVGFADSNLYAMTPADIDRTLDSMQAMGVNDVRILLPWALMEPIPGYDLFDTADYIVNAADQRGMGVLGVLNSTPAWATEPGQPQFSSPPASDAQFAEFASTVATRYAGKISAYEVWNEPNTAFFYTPEPDAADYTRMLEAVYPAIKAADPNATVVGGVLISVVDYGNITVNPIKYLDQMYQAGAQGSFDALSFHPYQFTMPFSVGGYFGEASPIVQMEKMHELMVANGDGDKLIWSTEYGTPTSVVDENTQAALIQDYLTTWSTLPYAGPSFIYTTRDIKTDSTNVDDTFGVLRDDWSWKPAAYVIQQWQAAHPSEQMPVELMAAMRTLEPNAPVATDPATGQLTTIDTATGEPVAVSGLTSPVTTATQPADAAAAVDAAGTVAAGALAPQQQSVAPTTAAQPVAPTAATPTVAARTPLAAVGPAQVPATDARLVPANPTAAAVDAAAGTAPATAPTPAATQPTVTKPVSEVPDRTATQPAQSGAPATDARSAAEAPKAATAPAPAGSGTATAGAGAQPRATSDASPSTGTRTTESPRRDRQSTARDQQGQRAGASTGPRSERPAGRGSEPTGGSTASESDSGTSGSSASGTGASGSSNLRKAG